MEYTGNAGTFIGALLQLVFAEFKGVFALSAHFTLEEIVFVLVVVVLGTLYAGYIAFLVVILKLTPAELVLCFVYFANVAFNGLGVVFHVLFGDLVLFVFVGGDTLHTSICGLVPSFPLFRRQKFYFKCSLAQ